MSAADRPPESCDLMLGIGCQRGVSSELLERGIHDIFARHGLLVTRVRAVATSEHKRDEAGLLTLCQRRAWPLTFYTPEQLTRATLAGSARVQRQVGTPAVAEPAALLLAGARELLVHKTRYAEPGSPGSMTLAVARGSSPRHD